MSQGIWIASRSWKGQGNGLSPEAAKREHSPANTLILSSMKWFFNMFFKNFILFNWRIITLQYCDGFCHIAT